jgi:hypothetical protein
MLDMRNGSSSFFSSVDALLNFKNQHENADIIPLKERIHVLFSITRKSVVEKKQKL